MDIYLRFSQNNINDLWIITYDHVFIAINLMIN